MHQDEINELNELLKRRAKRPHRALWPEEQDRLIALLLKLCASNGAITKDTVRVNSVTAVR